MNEIEHSSSGRQTVINTLAVTGFIALVAFGIWLAVYATRFVPPTVDRIGAAAVYLGSVFTPAPEEPSLSVISPSASTTIPFGPVTTTTSTSSTTTPVVVRPVPVKPVPVTPGTPTSGVYPIGASSTPANFYGLPDLIVTVNAVGYLATTAAESFVASSTVPAGARPAVRFTIKNVGTNIALPWRFSASIPTSTAYIFQSQMQQALNPGDSIDYTFGFDQANRGSNQTISITANFDRTVGESNMNNNSASVSLTILGG